MRWMVRSESKYTSMKEWLAIFSDTESLEAPRREFIGHRDIITRNLSRYHFIAEQISGNLIEIGCGRGYGLEVLVPRSNKQVGIDISPKFLAGARRGNPGVFLACASGDALPLASDSFDSVIAFDVIEHVQDDFFFTQEIRRVARKGAFIALSTPNRLISSGNRDTPLNRFHMREYLAADFRALLMPVFPSVKIFGQFDPHHTGLSGSTLLDRIPMRWKYLLPHSVQCLLSVAIRSPLRLEDCRFDTENLDHAHTFVALCRA